MRDVFADFFLPAKWRTHVITGCSSGARYRLQITRQDASDESNSNFCKHIEMEYSSVMGISKYREYLARRESKLSILRGSPQLSSNLANNSGPSDQWIESTGGSETHDIINVQVDSIYHLHLRSPIPPPSRIQEIGEKTQRASAFIQSFSLLQGF